MHSLCTGARDQVEHISLFDLGFFFACIFVYFVSNKFLQCCWQTATLGVVRPGRNWKKKSHSRAQSHDMGKWRTPPPQKMPIEILYRNLWKADNKFIWKVVSLVKSTVCCIATEKRRASPILPRKTMWSLPRLAAHTHQTSHKKAICYRLWRSISGWCVFICTIDSLASN